MRRYRAVIIDFKRIIKRATALLLAGATAALAIYMMGTNASPEEILMNNVPMVSAMRTGDNSRLNRLTDFLLKVFIGYNPKDCSSILRGTAPMLATIVKGDAVKSGFVLTNIFENKKKPVESLPYIPEENRAPIKAVDASQRPSEYGIAIGNQTSYGVDIGGILNDKPNIDMGGSGPKILITHTHATEGYAPIGAEIYDVTAGDRTEDVTKNVVAVGEKMAEVFAENGIEVLHDKILHDAPSFNGSYAHSLSTVLEYTEKYPSIQVVLDLHRDSIVYDDKTKAKTVTEINGQNAAQLMFVVGTDGNGLHHPNWRENIKSAIHFQKHITESYPKLMRHINLRKERFNGHTSNASMIIEVGTSGNSLDEAMYGIELAAECIADYLNSL